MNYAGPAEYMYDEMDAMILEKGNQGSNLTLAGVKDME